MTKLAPLMEFASFGGLGFFTRNSLGPIEMFPKAPFCRVLTELGVPVSQIWQRRNKRGHFS